MQVPARLQGHGLKRFVENLAGMTTLNVATYLFPLILVPILLTRLGQLNYSVVLFVQATMAFLLGFADFGFSLTGTKLISRDRENAAAVRAVFWMIVFTKLVLFCLASLALVFLHARTTLLKYDGAFFAWGALQVLGQVLLVDWYFRGINELRAISVFNLVVRALSFAFVLALVREPGDTLLVLQINGVVTLAMGLTVFAVCLRRVGFARPRWSWWRLDFDSLWHNGLTGLLNTFSRQGHLFVIRQFLDAPAFAVYGVAFKIVISTYAVLSALPQTIFSHMGDKVEDRARFARWLGRFLALNVLVYLAAALALIAGAPLLVRLLSIDDATGLFVAVMRRLPLMLACAGVTTVLSATFGVLTSRERTQFYTLLTANLAMAAYLVWLQLVRAAPLAYAWSLPILEAVWATLLLRAYLKYRKMSP